jgi:hypothetical protein
MNVSHSTPFATYHEDIRSHFDNKDHEVHPAHELNQAISIVLRLGEVANYRVSPDGQSVEPQLTPESDQDAYNLLVKSAALKFRKSLTKNQIFELETEIYYLKNV